MAAEPVIAHFRKQSEACFALGSPLTAQLLRHAAALLEAEAAAPQPAAWAKPLLAWPGDLQADAVALRLAGALHRAVLDDLDPDLAAAYADPAKLDETLVAAALARNARLLAHYLQSPPQTNEVMRSAVLLGGFLDIAAKLGLPLALHEIGASAGLNLNWDAYRYDFGSWQWGDPAATTRLQADWTGALPPQASLRVARRAGCDRAPLDASDATARQRLLSYIWPDQTARLARIRAALDFAARAKVRVIKAEAADWVEAQHAARRPGTAFVLYHSIVWQYIDAAQQQRITAAMQAAGADATPEQPLAWLRFEPGRAKSGAELSLTLWTGGEGLGETRTLAIGDYHGRWVKWLL